jgi:hypothetical protein
MQVLAFDESNPPTMTSIWALRGFLGFIVFQMTTMAFVSLSKRVPSIEDLFIIIIVLVILIISIDLFVLKSIVYLSEDEVILKGLLRTRSYSPEDFVRVSVYNTLFSVTFIEFTDGKKYHILTRENSYTPNNNNLFKDYTYVAHKLDRQVQDYFGKTGQYQ